MWWFWSVVLFSWAIDRADTTFLQGSARSSIHLQLGFRSGDLQVYHSCIFSHLDSVTLTLTESSMEPSTEGSVTEFCIPGFHIPSCYWERIYSFWVSCGVRFHGSYFELGVCGWSQISMNHATYFFA